MLDSCKLHRANSKGNSQSALETKVQQNVLVMVLMCRSLPCRRFLAATSPVCHSVEAWSPTRCRCRRAGPPLAAPVTPIAQSHGCSGAPCQRGAWQIRAPGLPAKLQPCSSTWCSTPPRSPCSNADAEAVAQLQPHMSNCHFWPVSARLCR